MASQMPTPARTPTSKPMKLASTQRRLRAWNSPEMVGVFLAAGGMAVANARGAGVTVSDCGGAWKGESCVAGDPSPLIGRAISASPGWGAGLSYYVGATYAVRTNPRGNDPQPGESLFSPGLEIHAPTRSIPCARVPGPPQGRFQRKLTLGKSCESIILGAPPRSFPREGILRSGRRYPALTGSTLWPLTPVNPIERVLRPPPSLTNFLVFTKDRSSTQGTKLAIVPAGRECRGYFDELRIPACRLICLVGENRVHRSDRLTGIRRTIGS